MSPAEHARRPVAVRLELTGGARLEADVSEDDSLAAFVESVLDARRPNEQEPFRYPPRYPDDDPRSGRQKWADQKIAEERPGLRRLLVPEGGIVVRAGLRGDHLPKLISVLNERINLVYFPWRIRTTRNLTDLLRSMLRCRPDAVVFGLGLEDFLIDAGTQRPLVELDEFRYRLEYVFGELARERVTPIAVLNPPVGESVDDARGLLVSERAARPYIEALSALATKAGAPVVDLADTYRDAAPDDDWLTRSVEALSGTVASELSSDGRLGGFASVARGLTTVAANVLSRMRRPDRSRLYELPLSGTVSFDDRTQVPLDRRSAELVYLEMAASAALTCRVGVPPWTVGLVRPLQLLGGRNAFERTRQRQIIDRLAECERPGLPRVLIIGDSIRMRTRDSSGYGLPAYERLLGRTNITHIPHNCGGSSEVVNSLDDWLSCAPDVVHLNAGLHDLVFGIGWKDEIPSYNTIDDYTRNVEAIARRLVASSARKIIWASSTPVHEEWHATATRSGRERSVGRSNADVRAYNAAAAEVVSGFGIPINDLFETTAREGVERMLLRDGVHLTARAGELLGAAVAEVVLSHV